MSKNKQNPYESPQNANSADSPKAISTGRLLFAVALGILSIPASAIAFFTTCLATYDSTQSEFWPWIVGTICGVAVGGLMIFFVVRLMRR